MARFDPAEASVLIAAARADAGLTQAALAERVGISQPNLAAMERGSRIPSTAMLERVLEAADYRPSVALVLHREDVRAAATSRGLTDVRVFGSMVRGDDHFDSDIDLFVNGGAGAGLMSAGAFAAAVERLTGFPVDVIAEESAAKTSLGSTLLATAVPL
ncbi:helix-turn-helix domain-containing protein [Agromyces larvae]|uniref:Helix-turn-helix domain-containing protein n=1 Tax=Agromyces larvae TaxID=2929802 RepID=A0ABY4C345_9MICO|nr:helix-turn-helix domain-containing protein [Agromyces larvae]UOE45624.1 helix-turn-helix domain-containing protein [Agromyces larvae]